ncbi:MAG TPA: GNAT family protein [Actinoplanes sp.]|nr:GNAT family protein [Actinoplanes sp.]
MSGLVINGDGVRLRAADPADRPAGQWWTIVDPQSGQVLGTIGLTDGVVDVEVVPAARRRGVATAALRALSRWAFEAGHRRLEVLTTWENAIAQRVAMAAGYQREGVRRGACAGVDMLPFARLAGDPPGPTPRLLPDLPGGELTDGVVTLRPLDAGDIGFYTDLHAVPDVIETSVPPARPSAEDVRRRCTSAAAHWLAGTRADLVIVDTASGAPTGVMGLFYQEPATGQAMIGYSQLPAWRRLGYPTRAAQLLSLWVFAETAIARLIAGTMPANVGSQRVLEKAGFTREGYLRSRLPGRDGKRVDDVQFVLLPEDVLARTADAQG